MPLFTSQHRLWQVRHAPSLRWSEAGQRYEAPNALRSPLVKSDLLIPGSEDPVPCFYICCWKLPAAPAISTCSGREVSATLKPELRSSGFLSLLFLRLCLEAGTLSLGVCPSGLFYCEENPCFFLFFTKVFYSIFVLQALPSPSASPHCSQTRCWSTSFTHLIFTSSPTVPTSSFHSSLPEPSSPCCSRQSLYTLPFSLKL